MKYRIQQEARDDTMLINMGPSHPAMHGTTRIMLELDGEKIINCELEMGYLHRGFEKICENKTYFNMLIYTDRMNYVSPLINNTGYVMTLEKMLGIEAPERAQYIRVILNEFSRVCDHLTALAAMCMECGAFTVFLYMMKAREYIWDLMEQTSGARMTTSFIRVLPIPEQVSIPLFQHIGAPPKIMVERGEEILVGQQLASSEGFISSSIHSSVSGKVLKIDNVTDISGYKRTAIVIKVDGDNWLEDIDRSPALKKEIDLEPHEIIQKVHQKGIVGMGK